MAEPPSVAVAVARPGADKLAVDTRLALADRVPCGRAHRRRPRCAGQALEFTPPSLDTTSSIKRVRVYEVDNKVLRE